TLLGLTIWTCLACACGDKAPAKATREDCTKVAEHIAELVIADAVANPADLFDRLASVGGVPDGVTKDGFGEFLATPEGKTLLMQMRGQTLSATQLGIDSCVDNALKSDTACLLAAKSRADVDACDAKAN